MAQLHLYGWAKEYRIDGYVHGIQLTWQKEQRFDSENQPTLMLP